MDGAKAGALHAFGIPRAWRAPASLTSKSLVINAAMIPLNDFFCPVCFDIFKSNDVNPAYPICCECGSEGMDFELVRVEDFLREASLDRLQEIQREWSQATGFLEKYKSAKAARVEQMIQFKKDYDSGHGTD